MSTIFHLFNLHFLPCYFIYNVDIHLQSYIRISTKKTNGPRTTQVKQRGNARYKEFYIIKNLRLISNPWEETISLIHYDL